MPKRPIDDLAAVQRSDLKRFANFFHGCLKRGVYFAPSQFETGFISCAHSAEEIDQTARVVGEALSRRKGNCQPPAWLVRSILFAFDACVRPVFPFTKEIRCEVWPFGESLYNSAVMTTANKITIVRIAMIPAFVLMAIYYGQSIQRGAPEEWQRFTAIVIFLVAAVSDGLDGYVARRYNQRSALGVVSLIPIAGQRPSLSVGLSLSASAIGAKPIRITADFRFGSRFS